MTTDNMPNRANSTTPAPSISSPPTKIPNPPLGRTFAAPASSHQRCVQPPPGDSPRAVCCTPAHELVESKRRCTIAMLRRTFPVVAPHLLHIINNSIIHSELPPSWKAATIVPLHKSGGKDSPSNYRPISISGVACGRQAL